MHEAGCVYLEDYLNNTLFGPTLHQCLFDFVV